MVIDLSPAAIVAICALCAVKIICETVKKIADKKENVKAFDFDEEDIII